MTMLKGYIQTATGGMKRLGCLNMARDLMADDPAKFKTGYTAGNAYIALIEQAGREGITLTEGDREFIGGAIGIPRDERLKLEGMVTA